MIPIDLSKTKMWRYGDEQSLAEFLAECKQITDEEKAEPGYVPPNIPVAECGPNGEYLIPEHIVKNLKELWK